MSANVESMAYVGQVPWHGLGNEIAAGATTAQMLKAAELDWEVGVEPARWFTKDEDGKKRQHTSSRINILYRKDTGADLSQVGPRYEPFQNHEVLDFFREYVDAGDAVIETAGSLNDGQYIWALADLKAGYNLGTKKNPDEVKGKVLLMNPHQYGRAAIAKLTEIRVVCWNTMTAAIKGAGESVSLWHNAKFDEIRQQEAKRKLGIAREQLEAAEMEAIALTQTELEDPVAIRIAAEVMRGDTENLDYEAQNRRTRRVLDLYNGEGIGSGLPTADGTAWGLLNAVTQYMDHVYGRSANNRIANAWLGGGEAVKRNTKLELLKVALNN